MFSQKEIKIKRGRSVFVWNDEILKSDMALSTTLTTNQINEISKEVRKKLSKLDQPIHPYDIAKITHFTLLESGYKAEAEKFNSFLSTRRKTQKTYSTKISFVVCKYCGVANSLENKICSTCGATLDRRNADAKII